MSVTVSICPAAAATSAPVPLISILFCTVMAPDDSVSMKVISVAVICVVSASVIRFVPV